MRPSTNPFQLYGGYDLRKRRVRDYAGKQWGYEGEPSAQVESAPRSQTLGRDRRFYLFFILSAGVISVLFFRVLSLQVGRGSELRAAAEENRIRLQPIPAMRGVVYDRHGSLLVRNVPNETLRIIPADLPKNENLRALAETLAPILQEDANTLFDELTKKRSYSFQSLTFREHLSYQTAMKIRLIEGSLPGVVVRESSQREYLAGSAFSHILGYTGKINPDEREQSLSDKYQLDDLIGKSGIELSYEAMLRGQDGKKQVEVDSLGKEKRVVASEAPILGENLFLSIDAAFQEKAHALMESMMKSSHATGGALVALDPRNGEVLAMVSAPSFDNNIFSDATRKDEYAGLLADERNPFFFRPISGQYPSGSTIKPLIASLALHENVIDPTTVVQSSGGIRIGQWFFPDWKPGGHGATTVRKAIAESVNSFFYTIGGGTDTFTGLGVERITKGLANFGLGRQTGIDLHHEAPGLLPTPEWKERVKGERWYIGDTYHLAIGQGDVLVTPLQMAVATSAVANGGTVFHPRLVTTIENADRTRTALPPLAEALPVADARSLAVAREGMRQAVESGSARSLLSLPVPAAAKTGTAQFGTGAATHSWFTAFAPYESPEIVLAVVLEGAGEGNEAALPVAKDALQWFFSTERTNATR